MNFARGLPVSLWLCVAMLVAGVVLGGASRENDVQIMILQVLGLAALALGAIFQGRYQFRPNERPLLLILAAMVLLLLLQLAPLPPMIWSALAGREGLEASLAVTEAAPSWRPISQTPYETHRALLWLIPPAVMLLLAIRLSEKQKQVLALLVVVGAVVSLAFGMLQMSGRDGDFLRLYPTVHEGLPIGFFSNRNHQAILMALSIPIAAVWGADIGRRVSDRERMVAISALLIILLLIVGVAVTRSRAGLALLVPALLGSLVIVWQRNAVGAQNKMILVVGGVMAVAIAAAAQFVLTVIVPRFDAMRESEVRFEAWPDVIRAASAVQPWGAGVGSFDPIYRSIERLDIMTAAFLNHAHNDYLEIWLEAGVFGALLLAAFLAWWWSVTIKAWRSSEKNRSSSLRRAASLVVGLLLVHSIFDYPLRTPLLAMVFALACACLVVHREEGGSPIRRQRSRAFSALDDRGE